MNGYLSLPSWLGGSSSGTIGAPAQMNASPDFTNQLLAFQGGNGAAGSGLGILGNTGGDWVPGNDMTGGGTNLGPGTPFGPNLGTGALALQGLSTLSGLWNAYQASAMANKTFNFNKNLANTNLANQVSAYNTNMEGVAGARYAAENKTPAEAAAYIAQHRLAQKTVG